MPVPLKVVFMGSDPIALPLLEWLAGEGSATARLLAIYSRPDRPALRAVPLGISETTIKRGRCSSL
jgi:methionyl-tRNA formyltransferase